MPSSSHRGVLVLVLPCATWTPAADLATARPKNLYQSFKIETTSLAKGAYRGKFLNPLHDAGLRGSLQLWVHREGKDLRRDPFCDGKVASLESESFVGLLQMQRDRIVNTGVDLRIRQVFLQPCAICYSHHIQVVDWPRP